MSELFFLLGEMDNRVRLLFACIRHWATSHNVIKNYPQSTLTNFGLTCLLIYYLQQLDCPILPSVASLNAAGTQVDMRYHELGKVSSARSVDKIEVVPANSDTLLDLLRNFFHFYAEFDFGKEGISTHYGARIAPTNTVMHIDSPLDPKASVAKFISKKYRKELQSKMREASERLGECSKKKSKGKEWGLVKLFS